MRLNILDFTLLLTAIVVALALVAVKVKSPVAPTVKGHVEIMTKSLR